MIIPLRNRRSGSPAVYSTPFSTSYPFQLDREPRFSYIQITPISAHQAEGRRGASLYHLGVDRRISILGVEWNMLPHLLLGAPGAMGGSDWIPAMCATYAAFKSGDMNRAWELQKAIAAQSPLLIPRVASSTMGSKIESSGIGYLKARFSLMSGIDLGPPLPPYRPASAAEVERAKKGTRSLEALIAKPTQ